MTFAEVAVGQHFRRVGPPSDTVPMWRVYAKIATRFYSRGPKQYEVNAAFDGDGRHARQYVYIDAAQPVEIVGGS